MDFSFSQKVFLNFIFEVFESLSKEENVEFKERKTITGKRFLLMANPSVMPYKTFVNLDFSFKEKVIFPQKSIIKTDYPVLFTSFVFHLSKEEILAEKIRAILTRKKGRDLYDLWSLLTQGVEINEKLVREKLKYYGLGKIKKEEVLKNVEQFLEKDFILDLRPFVPLPEREKLSSFFNYLKDCLKENLPSII